MPRKPPTRRAQASPWYSTPNERRKAKSRLLTLTDETYAELERVADRLGTSRSGLIELLARSPSLERMAREELDKL